MTATTRVSDDIYFDPADRVIMTRCTKCQAVIRLGGIGDAPTAKRAVIILSERPGMCPPLAFGGFAPWAHPELGFYSYWQIGQVLALIDVLVDQGVLTTSPPRTS